MWTPHVNSTCELHIWTLTCSYNNNKLYKCMRYILQSVYKRICNTNSVPLWRRRMNPTCEFTCEPHMWTPHVNPTCELHMWTSLDLFICSSNNNKLYKCMRYIIQSVYKRSCNTNSVPLWRRRMNPTYEPHMWTPHVNSTCELHMWTPHINIVLFM